jgi:hypothetical protein
MGKLHNITVRFTDEQLVQLQNVAKKETRPVANLIVWIVLQYLERRRQCDG